MRPPDELIKLDYRSPGLAQAELNVETDATSVWSKRYGHSKKAAKEFQRAVSMWYAARPCSGLCERCGRNPGIPTTCQWTAVFKGRWYEFTSGTNLSFAGTHLLCADCRSMWVTYLGKARIPQAIAAALLLTPLVAGLIGLLWARDHDWPHWHSSTWWKIGAVTLGLAVISGVLIAAVHRYSFSFNGRFAKGVYFNKIV